MTAFIHSGGKNSHDRIFGRPHLSTLLQWDLNCQDRNFEGQIPIIHTVWIVGIPTSLWTVPDFFQTSPIWKEGFTLIKKKWSFSQLQRCISYFWESLDMILQGLFPLGLLFSYTFLKFMKPHSGGCLTLSHWPLTDIHSPPPPLLFLELSKRPSPVGAEVGAVPYSRQWRGVTLPFPKRESRSLSYPMRQKNLNCLSLLDDWVLQKDSLLGSVEASPWNVREQMEKGNLRYTLSCHHLQFSPSSPHNCHLFSLGQTVLGWVPYDSGFILSPVLFVFCGVYCTHKALIRPIL